MGQNFFGFIKRKSQRKRSASFSKPVNSKYQRNLLGEPIGKGYPAPNTKFRWCTERMKIRPSDRFLRKIAAESGEAVLVVGTRKAESSNRAQSIAKFEKEAKRENFNPHVNLSNISSFLPIKDWSNDDVWLYLLQEKWKKYNTNTIRSFLNRAVKRTSLTDIYG